MNGKYTLLDKVIKEKKIIVRF